MISNKPCDIKCSRRKALRNKPIYKHKLYGLEVALQAGSLNQTSFLVASELGGFAFERKLDERLR
jgi:hypothetical protein